MSAQTISRRSVSASRTAVAVFKTSCVALALAAAGAQANPLAGLAAINGVLGAIKQTAGGVKAAIEPAAQKSPRPKISLPGAIKIERGMQREAVLALVGEPAQSIAASSANGSVHDVYKVMRTGSCSIDQIEIVYMPGTYGVVKDIAQKCGDVTSNENRSVRYSFQQELPEVMDRLTIGMPREQAMAALGQPSETLASPKPSLFVDVYVLGADQMKLSYEKANKQLRAVGWNGSDVSLPRIQRADVFEAAGN